MSLNCTFLLLKRNKMTEIPACNSFGFFAVYRKNYEDLHNILWVRREDRQGAVDESSIR
jgi:type II restriction/modification system DNA methylase subunit YeeA